MGQRIVQLYVGRKGMMLRKQWRARVVAANGHDVLFISAEGYNNRLALEELCRDLFPTLPLEYLDHPSAI